MDNYVIIPVKNNLSYTQGIVKQLLEQKEATEIVIIDNLTRGRFENLSQAMKSGKVRLIEGDIRDRDLVRAASKDIDLVFHLAAIRITQCAEEPRLALEVLVDGTYNVLEACVKHKVKKLI